MSARYFEIFSVILHCIITFIIIFSVIQLEKSMYQNIPLIPWLFCLITSTHYIAPKLWLLHQTNVPNNLPTIKINFQISIKRFVTDSILLTTERGHPLISSLKFIKRRGVHFILHRLCDEVNLPSKTFSLGDLISANNWMKVTIT